MKKSTTILIFPLFLGGSVSAQSVTKDTIAQKETTNYLPNITVVGRNSKSDYQQLPDIVGTDIYAGKKSALIVLENVQGNLSTNTMRQVMAKIPGIQIWESDPSGIQIGIAARGLSPNRSWEFNTRQNGYDIAADPFGYPEAYYNPQLQAVQRIEVVRGQGSLQYGPQFGGMVNYILKNGSEMDKPFELESQQTVGSANMFNSFNAIGGKKGKIHYYAFFDHRNGDGWRQNSAYNTNSGFFTFTWDITNKLSVSAEMMRSNLRSQQAGGLTDNQLQSDPQQSFRSRNWFDITWTTPAIIANYKISEHTLWTTKLFGTIGDRNSVGYLQPITVADTINAATGKYNSRTVNADQYRNYGLESRMITDYSIGKVKNTISGGIRLYTGSTYRRTEGLGTTGTGYDMAVIGDYPKDITFTSANAALFVENMFRLSNKISVIPGARVEWLQGAANGRNGFDTKGNEIMLQDVQRSRGFALFGIGAEYKVTATTRFYGNVAQAYRPIQFANLQAPPTTDVIDPDLKDAKGYNADLGYKGKLKSYLQFDGSMFYLQYNDRVGAITRNGGKERFITNVGASTSMGFEGLIDINILKAFNSNMNTDLNIYGSYSFTDSKYSTDHLDANISGKQVENAPRNIFRGGISFGHKGVVASLQYSYVDKAYSDANNTEKPTVNGQTGLIPAYNVLDAAASWKVKPNVTIKAGLNNLTNETYFTRRAGGYPGPGALPADGRTFFASLMVKI